ncbi:MAG: sigma-70 family RNA polymerase sigma factor [Chloroherpetonaceae bacterium]|nr:sigma-70 family RNA polymerase sigma factor [Chloroherpetonaceae bacterium]
MAKKSSSQKPTLKVTSKKSPAPKRNQLRTSEREYQAHSKENLEKEGFQQLPISTIQKIEVTKSEPIERDADFPADINPSNIIFQNNGNAETSTLVEQVETEELEETIELPKEVIEIQKEAEKEKPSSREEDYALIDLTRGEDDFKRNQSYKRLLNKYRSPIYNLILKIVHDPNEVEDLVQETFSKAFNSLANFNKEFAFSTWLYRIATNSSIDFLRKRRLKTFSIDNPIKTKDDEYTMEIPDSSSEPGRNVIQGQRDALVREAIKQLPEKYRKVIEMRHLSERTYEEIAEDQNLPLGTVKAHIFRAREMLYKSLRDKLRNY